MVVNVDERLETVGVLKTVGVLEVVDLGSSTLLTLSEWFFGDMDTVPK